MKSRLDALITDAYRWLSQSDQAAEGGGEGDAEVQTVTIAGLSVSRAGHCRSPDDIRSGRRIPPTPLWMIRVDENR